MTEDQLLALKDRPDEQLKLLERHLAEAANEGIVRPLPHSEDQFNTWHFGPEIGRAHV